MDVAEQAGSPACRLSLSKPMDTFAFPIFVTILYSTPVTMSNSVGRLLSIERCQR